MSVSTIWKTEKSKRDSFACAIARCDRNWVFHKERAIAVFQELADIAGQFSVWDRNEVVKEYGDGQPKHFGYDGVTLTECDRFTRRRTVYNNGTSSHVDHEKVTGGSLTVHYTYGQGLIQIFLTPPISNQSIVKKEDILLWAGRNTDALTTAFFERLVSKFLVLGRVESSFEKSSVLERFRVRWWRFMDVRNRWQIYDTHVNLLNRWEVPIAAAILALAGLIISVAKL